MVINVLWYGQQPDVGGSSSYEVEDEFHRAEEDRGETPGDRDGDDDRDDYYDYDG